MSVQLAGHDLQTSTNPFPPAEKDSDSTTARRSMQKLEEEMLGHEIWPIHSQYTFYCYSQLKCRKELR